MKPRPGVMVFKVPEMRLGMHVSQFDHGQVMCSMENLVA